LASYTEHKWSYYELSAYRVFLDAEGILYCDKPLRGTDVQAEQRRILQILTALHLETPVPTFLEISDETHEKMLAEVNCIY
jgi:hypothetical protein